MNKNIIFGIGGLVLGSVVGFFVGKAISEKKQENKKNEDPYYVHLEYFDKQETAPESDDVNPYIPEEDTPEAVKETEEKKFIDYTAYSKHLQELKYKAENEHPSDEDEPEEEDEDKDPHEGFYETEVEHEERLEREASESLAKWKKEHEGKIELMTKKEWDSDFREEDYDRYELWYFPDEDALCDENGAMLWPKEKYVGTCFRKVGFESNDDEEIFIRNNIMEEDYYIHKETEASREEYFMEIPLN